jgi:hypothetical protein
MASFLDSRRRLQIPIDAGHLFRRDADGCRNAHQRAKATATRHTSVPVNRYVVLSPDYEVEGTDLCSRWFGNGVGLECRKLIDLDRSGALNVLAGDPTT